MQVTFPVAAVDLDTRAVGPRRRIDADHDPRHRADGRAEPAVPPRDGGIP